jgi:hypothetical protein
MRNPVVYVVEADGWYKIGWTRDLLRRLEHLRRDNPYVLTAWLLLETPYARQVEARLHRRYAAVRGLGEWFRLTAADLDGLNDHAFEAALACHEQAGSPHLSGSVARWVIIPPEEGEADVLTVLRTRVDAEPDDSLEALLARLDAEAKV